MRAKILSLVVFALASGCEQLPESPNAQASATAPAGVDRTGEFERAARMVNLPAPLPEFQTEGSVTPAVPVSGTLFLQAWDPRWWDPSDGTSGTIKLGGNGQANPGQGSRAGLKFEAESGRRYLALCGVAELSSAIVWNRFDGAAAGQNQSPLTASEFAALSNPVSAAGPATYEFNVNIEDVRSIGCTLFSFAAR